MPEHPITPPPELVQYWWEQADQYQDDPKTYFDYVATEAAQWGADQELLACGNYFKQCAAWEEEDVTEFYNYRRPRPLSLFVKHWRRFPMADYRAQRLARILADYERFTAHSNPMTDNNLIPPPELVQQWLEDLYGDPVSVISPFYQRVLIAVAQWGADQELEACLGEVSFLNSQALADRVRAARRPKPPSLKEQALEALRHAPGPDYPNPITLLTADEHALIRRALEQLDD
jgi:hypothetical protein